MGGKHLLRLCLKILNVCEAFVEILLCGWTKIVIYVIIMMPRYIWVLFFDI